MGLDQIYFVESITNQYNIIYRAKLGKEMNGKDFVKLFTEWIERKKRKHNCKVHFGSDSIKMKDCIVAPVHMISDEIYDNQELDFYVETKYDVYLLRIINKEDSCGIICPAKRDGIIYIISNLPVNRENITKQVKRALNSVEKYGFPNLKNSKFEVEFDIE